MNKKTKAFIDKEIKEANNQYIQELHREFINTHELNMKDTLILSKFLDFMIKQTKYAIINV